MKYCTMKYFLKFAFILRMELLDGAPYKVASAARERLWELALSLQCLGQWDFRPAAFLICFHKISHDHMIQMIRFHKSDSSLFGALQISTRQEMLFRDLRPCVSAKQWNVEEGFICFISLQARSKVILAFEDETRCVNMYLWSPLDPTKLICFRWSSELWCTRHRSLAHVGMLAFWCCNGFQPLPARPDASSYASLLHSLRGSNAAADPIGMEQTAFSATMQRCLK